MVDAVNQPTPNSAKAGRPCALSPQAQVPVTLEYWREYRTYSSPYKGRVSQSGRKLGALPMPAPYSLDLRQKAIAALEAGHAKTAVGRLMGIGTTTLTEWHNRYRASGEVAAKQGYQQGHSHQISDWEEFRAFAAMHGDKTQAEMAQLWPEEISEDTMGRALKRIGFTRKKELSLRQCH